MILALNVQWNVLLNITKMNNNVCLVETTTVNSVQMVKTAKLVMIIFNYLKIAIDV
jgi:hypothetical protein